jgi:methyltransferase OMS1
VENMTIKDNVFDTVVDTFGLDYTLYPEKCLKEMKRVCKPGGKILLLESGLSHYKSLNY